MHIGPARNTDQGPDRLPSLMGWLAIGAVVSMLLGLLLPQLITLLPSAPLHLALAAGIMPLILGAMTYFTPVLTRSGPPEPGILSAALAALAAGLLAFLSLALALAFRYYPAAAALALAAVIGLSLWMHRRVRATLGRPHPGLRWYQIALIALALGLAAIALGALWPEQWIALKRLHLHLNLLGFVGLTALGTLRVLLPTVGGFADPQAGPWLMKKWRWLAGGTALIALGAAWLAPVSWLGLVLWLLPLGRLGHGLWQRHRTALFVAHGAAPALTAAIAGLLLTLLSSPLHGLGWIAGMRSTEMFLLAFLLPLVTGAITHLLPLWLGRNRPPDWQKRLRQRLGRYGALRGVTFVAAGLLALAGQPWAYLLALAALIHFLIQLLWGMMRA